MKESHSVLEGGYGSSHVTPDSTKITAIAALHKLA